MRLVCINCKTFMRPEKNGVYFEQKIDGGKPFRIWHADIWKCPECENMVLAGFGNNPLWESCQNDFEKVRNRLKSDDFIYIEERR